jgi:nicotinate-nucleotide adenylyltransferase
MRIGLFFGSFNPIHIGHLIIADHLALHGGLDKVWLVVSPHNPHKKRTDLAHEHDRYEMVRQAIYGNPRLEASDVEFRLPKPSYTVETLAYLASKRPGDKFVLIIGEDNLLTFHKWKNYQAILDYYDIIVYPRLGGGTATEQSDLPARYPNITVVNAPVLNISASLIRDRIKAEKPITYLVPEPVETYIQSKMIYF